MPFKFSWFCELLDELDQCRFQQRTSYAQREDHNPRIVTTWYQRYSDHIERHGYEGLAFLSALLPERRADRTYNLKEKRLTNIFGSALCLGGSRLQELRRWETRGGSDFATCVQQSMAAAEFEPPKPENEVTLLDIDTALTEIASNTVSSAPQVRAQASGREAGDILTPTIRRLKSSEAKWLIRMIMKSYSPVEIPEYAALHGFHFMMPRLLSIQNSFEASTKLLANPEIAKLPFRPSKQFEAALLPFVSAKIEPQLGVMIRKQSLYKARSIKHCVKMAKARVMSIERKYDGEYCQIHIDMSKTSRCIQIFAKSGRDSTSDRFGVYGAIKDGLRIGRPGCKIRERAILEGELVVYSRASKTILPFYHVRKHVRHGGRMIGTERDSPKKSGEQLMIVFFDLLLLDDKVNINHSHKVRRQYLKGLVSKIEGTARIVERAQIDFKHSKAPIALREAFGAAIRKRWEGFVLKGLDEAYYSWKEPSIGIKLKKDYIAGLGDTADMCIVGGRRDARAEAGLELGDLTWTFFYLACLVNKAEVSRYDRKPIFTVVDRIGPGNLSKADIIELNLEGKLVERDFVLDSEYMSLRYPRKDFPPPTALFSKPIVVEIMGAGYERPQTVDFFTLRFPRRAVGSNLKLHRDRDVVDTVSFNELQDLAQKSLMEDKELGSQEEAAWIERLMAADPKSKYNTEKSQSTSPSKTPHSATTISLTPASNNHASTQPSPLLIRMDSDELTAEEWQDRYPDSAPQTPSRQSEATASPATERRAGVKRMLPLTKDGFVENNPSKKKRVTFESFSRIRKASVHSPLSDITNTADSPTRQPQRDHRATAQTSVHDFAEHRLNAPPVAGLPTPPSTEKGAKAVVEPEQVAVANSNVRPTTSANHAPLCDLPDHEQILDILLTPIGCSRPRTSQIVLPFLITPLVRSTSSTRAFIERLETGTDVSMTHSIKHFLASISAGQTTNKHIKKKHIVLVDTHEIEQTIPYLQHLSKRIRGQTHDIKDATILLFDYKVLETSLAKANFASSRRDFDFSDYEQFFCGVLKISDAFGEHGRPGACVDSALSVREALSDQR